MSLIRDTVELLKKNLGLVLCIVALISLFVLKLPLNLSVLCANQNQGFGFGFGLGLLNGGELSPGRGPVYVFIYFLILKLFGFNTYSILALHAVETVVLLFIGLLLYLILRKLLGNIYGGLAVLFWVILISTPIGGSNPEVEILSHYYLSEESVSVLLSLLSIYCLLCTNIFHLVTDKTKPPQNQFFSFLAGALAICAFMSKANGLVLLLAVLCFFVQIFTVKRDFFLSVWSTIAYYLLGVVCSFIVFSVFFYVFHHDLILSYENYFSIGSYTTTHLTTLKAFVTNFSLFFTRHSESLSNVVILASVFSFFFVYFLYGFFPKRNINPLSNFFLFLSIWAIGNLCAIILPGQYQPYYYQLIWPNIAIFYTLVIYCARNRKIIKWFFSIFLISLFSFKIFISAPAHVLLAKYFMNHSVFKSPQSFEDPVTTIKENKRQSIYLEVADAINTLLPEKEQTFYVFNFGRSGYSVISPLTYIYSKRQSPTTIDCDLLKISNLIKPKIDALKKDLTSRHPEFLILSKYFYPVNLENYAFKSFFNWFMAYVEKYYEFLDESTIEYILNGENKSETFLLYKRKLLSNPEGVGFEPT